MPLVRQLGDRLIRGAIEVAQKNRIAGWIYSSSEPLRKKTILAFVGGRCVGAGVVDGFRQDLLDAKLGDGVCGFDFAMKLAAGESPGSVIVRLQYSDAALLQQSSQVLADNDDGNDVDLGAIPPGNLSWLLENSMLDQSEHDFLKAIYTIGAFEYGLNTSKRGAEPKPRLDPESAVKKLLSVLMLSYIHVARSSVSSVADLKIPHGPIAPVMALWSKDRGLISLDERSHLAGQGQAASILPEPPPGGIDYGFGGDMVLFVHRACAFSARGPAPASGITLFTASATRNLSAARAA